VKSRNLSCSAREHIAIPVNAFAAGGHCGFLDQGDLIARSAKTARYFVVSVVLVARRAVP
jgi:hypothetical protein